MWKMVPALALLGLAGLPASACALMGSLSLADVMFADVVAVGHIRSFRTAPFFFWDSTPEYRRLSIDVEEVLLGDAPDRLDATWRDLWHGMPVRLPSSGSYLVALRWPTSPNPDGFVPDAPEPDAMTVLQSACDPPFITEADSEAAQAIREVLDGQGDAQAEIEALSRSVNMNRDNVWSIN